MNTSLQQFIKRNRHRNASLYSTALVEGLDYVVCPVSKERMSMIKSSYIEKVLGMTVSDYDLQYPGARRVSEKRKSNIKSGLLIIDPITGMSKYDISQIKARAILNQIDSNGQSGYDRKGQKTKATHMRNVDEFGRNGYSQLASKAIVKGNATKAKKGLILDPSVRSEFYRYKSVVTYLTEKHRVRLTSGYVTGLAGQEGAYHIDHNYSIMQGYLNKISPVIIGNPNNLTMIPWKENLQKHAASSITLTDLLTLTAYTKEKSDREFDIVINLIRIDASNGIQVSGARILEKLYEATLQ